MARTVFDMDFDWLFHRGDEAASASSGHSSSYSLCKAGAQPGYGGKIAPADIDEWRKVNLPHDYFSESGFSEQNLLSHGYRTRDNAWYRKSFIIDEKYKGKQLFICFEGTAVNAEFYLNGSLMERSFSAYTETTFDITDRVGFGISRSNTIAVHIKGFETEGWWYEGAGLYRHVKLYAKDALHIAHNGIWAKPVLQKGTKNNWTVELETTLENSAYKTGEAWIKAELYDGDSLIASSRTENVEAAADSAMPVVQKFSVDDPTRWDVDNPKLYRLHVGVMRGDKEIDAEDTNIGFRTIAATAKEGFLLNGRKLLLKGTCNHQDHAGVGVAVPDSVQEYRIKRLKEMGTNAYRCSHNLPNKEILDLCDKYGLVVMDENRRFEARREVLEFLDIMVKRDRNHPCVAFWSLFNEEPLQNTEEGANIFRRMKSRVLKLDDTRIITGAINGNMEGAGLVMDMTGINYAINNWEAFHKMYPNQPIIGSENNSAVTTRGCYKRDDEKHELHCYDDFTVLWGQTVRQTWDAVLKNPWIGGIFIWTGFDYRGEPTPYQWPSVSSQFGIMDTCGFAKDSFYYNKACFTSEPMVHVMPHWNHAACETVRVAVPTNCEEVEIFVNGASYGKKSSDCINTPEWQIVFEPGEIEAVGYVSGKVAARDKRVTAGSPYAVKLMPERTTLSGDGKDTLVINVAVVDENGVVVPYADNLINFAIDDNSAAYVRGVGNGDPNSHEPDNANYRRAYCGLCQVLVTSLPGSGKFTFTARAEGLQPATLDIKVKKCAKIFTLKKPEATILEGFTMSGITDEMPDPQMTIADNDMNSFTPITFGPTHQNDFTIEGWRMYRAPVKDLCVGNKYGLEFENVVADRLYIYIGQQCICRKKMVRGGVTVPFTPSSLGELRIIVGMEKKMSFAGIRNPVRLNCEKID